MTETVAQDARQGQRRRVTKEQGQSRHAGGQRVEQQGDAEKRTTATERWRQRQNEEQELKVTVVTRGVNVGNAHLQRFLQTNWRDVQQALYYSCVIAPKVFGKGVGDRVQTLMETYINESLEAASTLRSEALTRIVEAGFEAGQHGSMKAITLKFFHPLQRQITNMCEHLDEYAAVTETMWIDQVMSQKEHEASDAKIRGACAEMRRLCNTMSEKMRQFMREKRELPEGKAGRTSDELCTDMEQWFFEKTGIDLRVERVQRAKQAELGATGPEIGGGGDRTEGASTSAQAAQVESTKEEAEAAVAA